MPGFFCYSSSSRLGRGHLDEGDVGKAQVLLEEALVLTKELANTDTMNGIVVLSTLGEISYHQGSMALARPQLEESVAIMQGEDADVRISKAWALCKLAKIAAIEGDHATARTLYEQGLAITMERPSQADSKTFTLGRHIVIYIK
jgi:ATP/maltotriose-dependent transcriptional regulator MalT